MTTSDVLSENICELKAFDYDIIEIQIGEERLCELRSEFCSLSGFSSILITRPDSQYRENAFKGIPVKTKAHLQSEIVFIVERPRPYCEPVILPPRHGEGPQKQFCPYCGERL